MEVLSYEDPFTCHIEVAKDIKVFVRCWGRVPAAGGRSILHVHGGPGDSIDGYEALHYEEEIFPIDEVFVVEVDQRGCGRSLPSVSCLISTATRCEEVQTLDNSQAPTQGMMNMHSYLDVTIDMLAWDFEIVREYLKGVFGVNKWLVFGGSWGSCLGLFYAQKYPEACEGLIIQGVFLNSVEECTLDYLAEDGAEDLEHAFLRAEEIREYYREFLRVGEVRGKGVNTSSFFKGYLKKILGGDRRAIWTWYAFENNLMVSCEEDLVKLDEVDSNVCFSEAQCISFFEVLLFHHNLFEREPALDLLADMLRLFEFRIPLWIVQGSADLVCPAKYARQVESACHALEALWGFTILKNYYCISDANHLQSEDKICEALQLCVSEFLDNKKDVSTLSDLPASSSVDNAGEGVSSD